MMKFSIRTVVSGWFNSYHVWLLDGGMRRIEVPLSPGILQMEMEGFQRSREWNAEIEWIEANGNYEIRSAGS